jgi:hypothetical protein
MMYKLSSRQPAAVVGKALPLRVRIKGRRIVSRPNPTLTNKKGKLPIMMKVNTRIRLKPVSL